ncbi:MAG: tRNA epoxyqueuosine(34) reductase QueG [Alphaproteobacteria bacterium]
MDHIAREGFDAAGIAPFSAASDAGIRLRAFVEAGWHGRMDWLARKLAWRADPRAMWSEARSAIVVGLSYAPEIDPLDQLNDKSRAAISVYAQGTDYHEVLKKRLKRVAGWLAERSAVGVKVFVDTAPVMEKPLARAAGLGWQGKHTNLVSREHGSWLFLGVILSALDLPADAPDEDHCGSCRACLDICPTKAFPAPYQLDARRCISYLTIEHDDHIPREFRESIGNRIYGCDDCLAVCPWNKFARASAEVAFHPREALRTPLLVELAALDDAAFRKLFSGSAIKRIGRDRFVRNVVIAVGNSSDVSLIEVARARLRDQSPLVRAAAIWALSRLMPQEAFAALAATEAPREADAAVRAEWMI